MAQGYAYVNARAEEGKGCETLLQQVPASNEEEKEVRYDIKYADAAAPTFQSQRIHREPGAHRKHVAG